MSDEDKKGPGTGPTPEELQRGLQELFGKMGNVQWAMPGMNQEVEDDEPEEARDVSTVFLRGYAICARGRTHVDGVQETWAEMPVDRVALGDVQVAGPETEDLLQELHGLTKRSC